MRVLFTTCPDKSIFQSLAPLAWALRTAGHEVRVASRTYFADTITQAGLTAVGVGRGRGPAPDSGDEDEGEELEVGLPYDAAEQRLEDLDWADLRTRYDYHVTYWHQSDNAPMIPHLVAFARHWGPDLVIWDPIAYGGSIAARAVGAAHARLLWGQDVFGAARSRYLALKEQQPRHDRGDTLEDWLGGHARKYGFDYSEDLATGQFTIDQLPGSLRMDAGLRSVPMRYTPYGGPATVPKWLWAQPERPRVAITLGITAAELFEGYAVGVQDILDSLADLDIEVVATIAEREQAKLGRIPDNARIVRYAPLQALAPTCAVVIHHAGFGTLATTSLAGVPQLALPTDFDEPPLARKLTEQGAGLTLHSSEATGDLVREHLLRVLNEPSFTRQAARLREEMQAMPSPNQIVPRLEELTTEYRGAEQHSTAAR